MIFWNGEGWDRADQSFCPLDIAEELKFKTSFGVIHFSNTEFSAAEICKNLLDSVYFALKGHYTFRM